MQLNHPGFFFKNNISKYIYAFLLDLIPVFFSAIIYLILGLIILLLQKILPNNLLSSIQTILISSLLFSIVLAPFKVQNETYWTKFIMKLRD